MKRLFVHPIFIVFLYWVMAVAFAFFYTNHKGEFYHSTSSIEPTTVQDSTYLRTLSLKKLNPSRVIIHDRIMYKSHVDFSLIIDVNNLRVKGEFAHADLTIETFEGYGDKGYPEKQIVVDSQLRHDDAGLFYTINPRDQNKFKKYFGKKSNSLNLRLKDTKQDIPVLNRWIYAMNGKGQYGTNNTVRMFYFSVVTKSTLGFGDIVPLSDNMRIAVIIQTFFGLFLIAWFAYTLTRKQDNLS